MKGFVHKYGDNIDTDIIIPARYLNNADPAWLAAHCMEDADANFAIKVKKGDIILGGENFGCGSSREHAPIAIKAAGISCVIAKSFARIFFRNSINIGLPIIELEDADDVADSGDELEVDIEKGIIRNLTSGRRYKMRPFPDFIKNIIKSGGLVSTLEVKEE